MKITIEIDENGDKGTPRTIVAASSGTSESPEHVSRPLESEVHTMESMSAGSAVPMSQVDEKEVFSENTDVQEWENAGTASDMEIITGETYPMESDESSAGAAPEIE